MLALGVRRAAEARRACRGLGKSESALSSYCWLWCNQAKHDDDSNGLHGFNVCDAIIFNTVIGMPFPAGVTGMVAQGKPNNQPEETV
jgi:hypothetical protein